MNRYTILLGKKLSEQDLVVYDIKKFRSECLKHAGPWFGHAFKEARATIRFLDPPQQLPQHWVTEQQGGFVFSTQGKEIGLVERLHQYRSMVMFPAVAREIDQIAEITR
jgi:hypothetical protein